MPSGKVAWPQGYEHEPQRHCDIAVDVDTERLCYFLNAMVRQWLLWLFMLRHNSAGSGQ